MTLLALIFAGMAAQLALPGRPSATARGPGRRLPGWLLPREDALRARTRWLAGAGTGLVAYFLAEGLGALPALGIGGAIAITTTVGLGRLEPPAAQRARDRRVQDLPEVLDLLGACLASGLPLRRAAREVAAVVSGPIREDLSRVVSLVDVGVGERQAWLSVADRAGWAGIGRDIARAAETGTGLRGALDRHAARARRNAQAARQERARTLGVRSVGPLMVCFLPAFLCLGIVPTVGSMALRVLG